MFVPDDVVPCAVAAAAGPLTAGELAALLDGMAGQAYMTEAVDQRAGAGSGQAGG
jgi:hypothetical protein